MCGPQATDWGMNQPWALGLCAQAAWSLIWVHTDLGFRCVLGLLIWCSHSRGCCGWGARSHSCCREFSKQLLSASIFSFSFQEFLPIQAPLVQTSTCPLTQPSLALSQESCSRPCTPARGFSLPGPRAGPRDLIVLKHSSYHLIFQCPLSLVCDLHICWNTIGCSLCSSDQLGVSLVPRGSGLRSHLSHHHL